MQYNNFTKKRIKVCKLPKKQEKGYVKYWHLVKDLLENTLSYCEKYKNQCETGF